MTGTASFGHAAEGWARTRELGAAVGPHWNCGGDDSRFVARSYTNHAGTRDYRLFVPPPSGRHPSPLVVMLHGCNQSPEEFALATRMNALAEDRGFHVVYPAQRQSANPARCWSWFDSSHQRRGHGEPAILAGLATHLVERHGLDDKRVYVAGLSAGGAMAVILGRLYPDIFAAVGVHSGLPYAAASDSRSALAAMNHGNREPDSVTGRARGAQAPEQPSAIPTIVFHGDKDTTVHPANALAVAAESAGRAVSTIEVGAMAASTEITAESDRAGTRHPYTRTRFRTAGNAIVVEQWLVHGGGHAWFGGDPRERYTDAKGPDASDETIRFFLSHALEPATRAARPALRSIPGTARDTASRSKQPIPCCC